MALAKRMWCAACCAAVSAVVKEAAATGAGALLGGATGALAGGYRHRSTFADVALLGALGALAGHVIEATLTPAVQRLVCANCGCSHLSELPS